MRVSQAKHGGRLRTSLAAHSINLRPRVIPPLPSWSFGNLQGRVTTRFVPDNGGNTEATMRLPELKDLVGSLIDSFTKSKERLVGREDVIPILLNTRNELHEAKEKDEVDVYMFTSWCRFAFYDVDFGWGKPVWLSRIHSAYESTALLDSEDGEGIETWLSFNKQDMPLFLRGIEEDILALKSTSKEPGLLSRRHFCLSQDPKNYPR